MALFRDTNELVIGESAAEAERDRIREIIERPDEAAAVLDLRTMYMGPQMLVVAARIDLRDDVDAAAIERLSDAIDRELHEEVEGVERVFLDPTPHAPREADRPVRFC